MQAVYSIGSKFAGGGIGNVAYHAVRGLYRHGGLQRLLCSSYRPTEIPDHLIRKMGLTSRAMRRLALYDSSQHIGLLHSRLYDRWSARHLLPCDIYHVWGNYGLHALKRAKALGAITIVERASSHPATQAHLLREEHARWGLPFRILPASMERAEREFEVADYVLIPSEFVRQSFLQQGFPEEKLIEVPFGVDTSIFMPADDRGASTPFRVLFVGQVSVRKGVLDLLDAWERLGWTDAELCIVGRPNPQIQPLLARWQNLPGVSFSGYTPNLLRTYQSADVFAFPTVEEGSAMVTYEAMACGLPIVTTANAGSLVRDGEEGLLVPIRDVPALCDALERLRSDTTLRTRMSTASRTKVMGYTWERYGDTMPEVYAGLLARAGGKRNLL